MAAPVKKGVANHSARRTRGTSKGGFWVLTEGRKSHRSSLEAPRATSRLTPACSPSEDP